MRLRLGPLGCVLLAILFSGCTGALKGGTISFGPPTRQVGATIRDPQQQPIVQVTGRFTPDNADEVPCPPTDVVGRLACVFTARTDHGILRLDAPGFQAWDSGEIDVSQGANLDVTLVPIPPAVVRTFPAEHGSIHVCGGRFCDEDGQLWQARGLSMYRLFGRYLAGEDLAPTIEGLLEQGVNVIRVWPEQDGGANRTYDRPDFDAQLSAFADVFAAAGVRIEFTAITEYHRPLAEDQRTVQRVYNAVNGRWNVFVECVNEPWNGGAPSPRAVCDGANRHGILSAYGYDPYHSSECPYPGATCPHLEYVTTHLPRELQYAYRNPHDLIEMRATGVPVWDDEPLGVAEYDRVGTGARSTDRALFVSHFGICRLYGAGCTVHSQAGLEGRLPSDSEPITAGIYDAVRQVWQAIPTAVAGGEYVRAPGGGSGGDFALLVTPADLQDGRGYGSRLGDVEYVVLPQSRDFPIRSGFTASPRGSWATIEPLGDVPGFYKATR